MFETVLIANRGEIALRVMRTLQRLGIASVAVHTPADRRAVHVRRADLALEISSYLDAEAIVDACRRSGAQALHPGYGFLSESPELSRACAAAGVSFVGPPAQAAEALGDKLRARELALASGIPVVGSLTVEQARAAGASAYPLLIKAVAGGGGRGMRVVRDPADLDAALSAAAREARAAFGDGRVFIERYLERARHIEVQVIADAHGGAVYLGERECSLQRRHQKLVEESPSPAVGEPLRRRLGEEAVALCRAAGYVNAGTVEFIAHADRPEEHYFLEVNARLQVEHPVTEMLFGVDLVELQLRVAAGEPLGISQDELVARGHAIEARVCAEDAARGFLPAAGRVLALERPRGQGVRVDDALAVGATVSTDYDSLLAKVIAHGEDRRLALARLGRALRELNVLGVTTTTAYLRGLLEDPDVRAGRLDTALVQRRGVPVAPMDERAVASTATLLDLAQRAALATDDPFERVDGWRLCGGRAAVHRRLSVAGAPAVEVEVPTAWLCKVTALGDDRFAIDGRGEWLLARDGETIWIAHGGWSWPVAPARGATDDRRDGTGELRAPMPGRVLALHARAGDRVRAGDPLIVLESMKMELVLSAPADGELGELAVGVGDQVAVDQPLARVIPVAIGIAEDGR